MTSTASGPAAEGQSDPLELSIVMPCLNEAETIGTCVHKARRFLEEHGVAGEVIVADNGSQDGSQRIAAELGARIVSVAAPGYGNALAGGIAAARGRFIVMGDADDSYDFTALAPFLERLREGYDLVQGCRLPAGGGQVRPGAMPFSHRWLGNPAFSLMARGMFRAPIHDVYCGLRGFTRELFERLELRCTGMEFATEMIIKSSLLGARIVEVPVTLHQDGRKTRKPHLRTVRDGWRTLRFFLMCSPRWLFLYPGAALILAGLAAYAVALPGLALIGVTFDAHTLLFGSLALMLGWQSLLFAVLARTFAQSAGILPASQALARLFALFSLERSLALAGLVLALGIALLVVAIGQWRAVDFGRLEYAQTMRWVIPGVTLTALGFQTALSSFFVSLLELRRR
jgi:glycosyltransferase involved in cell wall biosynthesis